MSQTPSQSSASLHFLSVFSRLLPGAYGAYDLRTGEVYSPLEDRWEVFGESNNVRTGDPIEADLALLPPEDLPGYYAMMQAVADDTQDQVYTCEHRLRLPSGRELHMVAYSMALRRDEQGRTTVNFGVTVDITRAKRLEKALELAEAHIGDLRENNLEAMLAATDAFLSQLEQTESDAQDPKSSSQEMGRIVGTLTESFQALILRFGALTPQ